MLVTEKQAKTKACLEFRVHSAGEIAGIGINAYAKQDKSGREIVPFTHCIGSKCMAWRWHDPEGFSAKEITGRRGYCGKAGVAKL